MTGPRIEQERMARLGDVPVRYLPPAPRAQPPLGHLCQKCGVRHTTRTT